jgi:hypothetical protein
VVIRRGSSGVQYVLGFSLISQPVLFLPLGYCLGWRLMSDDVAMLTTSL